MIKIKTVSNHLIALDTVDLNDKHVEMSITGSKPSDPLVNILLDKDNITEIISNLARIVMLDKISTPPISFEVGDKVTDIYYGKTEVIEVNDDTEFPVITAGNGTNIPYSKNGYEYGYGTMRTLFHGHELQFIILGEKKPKRNTMKYINLYKKNNLINTDGVVYETEDDAINGKSTTNGTFLKTVTIGDNI